MIAVYRHGALISSIPLAFILRPALLPQSRP